MGLSAAASTSGWPYKHPGRVGDTPIIGGGLYVDSRYGGACCTHTGEMSIRIAAARFMVDQMAGGNPPAAAVARTIEELSHLSGGYLRTLVLHAVDREGNAHAAAVNAAEDIYYWYWHEELTEPERRKADMVQVDFFR